MSEEHELLRRIAREHDEQMEFLHAHTFGNPRSLMLIGGAFLLGWLVLFPLIVWFAT